MPLWIKNYYPNTSRMKRSIFLVAFIGALSSSAHSQGIVLNFPDTLVDICLPGSSSIEFSVSNFMPYGEKAIWFYANNVPPGTSVSFNSNPVFVDSGMTATSVISFQTSGATPVGSYLVEVRAQGAIASDSITFVIMINNTGAPLSSLLSPPNGATGLGVLPAFSWSNILTASGYDLQIATDNSFSNVIVSKYHISGTACNLTNTLSGGALYYWRIRATNSCGVGNWSPSWSFTTAQGIGINTSQRQNPMLHYQNGYLFLKADPLYSQVQIFSVTGQEMANLNKGTEQIDVTLWPNGVYLVLWTGEHKKQLGKFVK